MNAVANNSFTASLRRMHELCPAPRAILCISAHWMTKGTWVTHMQRPRTIHDFYGFPPELFAVQYPAPGSPSVADEIIAAVGTPKILPDDEKWGLDHGTWSVLRHVFPAAEIPVLQLSLDLAQPPQYHFSLGAKLRALREQRILVVGSCNIVHNLQQIRWEPESEPYEWAVTFDEWTKAQLLNRDFAPLINNYQNTQAGRLSVPTPEHYYPLLYILGAADKDDHLHFEFEGLQNGSISMRTLSFRAT